MPDDPTSASPNPDPTPTGYQRTPKGRFVWQAPAVEELEDQFTQYQVLDLLGRGGMGAVYRAFLSSAFARPLIRKTAGRAVRCTA